MKEPRQYSNREIYVRMFREIRPLGLCLAALLFVSLLSTPIALLNPLPLKLMIDCVLGNHDLPKMFVSFIPSGSPRTSGTVIGLIAGLMVLIALAKLLLDLGFSLLRTYTGEKLVLAFRAKLFRHSQRLSLSYHDAQGSADSVHRIQYDAPAIQWIAVDAIIPLITSALTLLCMIVVMAKIDPLLAAVALTVIPLLYLASQRSSRRLKLQWREAKEIESSTLGVVQEVISSVRIVKVFAQEDRENRRYLEQAGKSVREQLRLATIGGGFSLIVGLIMAIGSASVLFMGVRHVQSGRITLGELILVMTYLAMLYSPLQAVSKSAASLQGSLVSMERTLALLDESPDVVEKSDAKPLVKARGHVQFTHVTFGYRAGRNALYDISFEIAPGSAVGIAGTTGAGKSTLMSLLLRLYDPLSGHIFLDGIDLRDYKVRDLRNQFSIVLQEPVLFSTTIGENIAYARPDAAPAEITNAAKAANAHEFIQRLPHGYETQVGERGLQLSGGERQRISLARAFLKTSPILILDEPTSSVDAKTESAILEAMARLMKGRTTFMIAHRLSTLDICNVRLHLERGRLHQMQSEECRVQNGEKSNADEDQKEMKEGKAEEQLAADH